tara:strand:- start:450 stop:1733 length:1284 start_codon:yes stop_codon:yes gene_type:complete
LSANVRGGSIEQAEKALLGALLIEPEYVDDVAEHLRPEDFYSEQHKEIFKAFVALSEKGYSCDMLSLCRYMETTKSKFVANGSYLADLMCQVPVHQTIPQSTELVRNGSLQRKVMDCTKDLMSNAITGSEDGITSSIKALVDLWDSGSVKEFCSLTSAANKYVKMLKQMETGEYPRWNSGVSLFDDICNESLGGGLHPGQLMIACGRAGAGKTTIALYLVRELVRHNKDLNACFFSLELSSPTMGGKLVRTEMGFDSEKSFRENAEEGAKVIEDTYGDRIQIIDHTGMSPQSILAGARRMARAGVKIFVIDHLHRVGYPQAVDGNLRHQIGDFCKRLTDFAKDYGALVIVCAQLNRSSEREQRAPMISDIAESGQVEQHADIILAIYSEPSRRDEVKFALIKNRHGPPACRTFRVSWKHQRFMEMEG